MDPVFYVIPGMKEMKKQQKYRPFRPYSSAITENLFGFFAIQ